MTTETTTTATGQTVSYEGAQWDVTAVYDDELVLTRTDGELWQRGNTVYVDSAAMTAITYTDDQGREVSAVPGQPGRVITGRPPLWTSDSGQPDPISRPSDPFAYFRNDDEDDL